MSEENGDTLMEIIVLSERTITDSSQETTYFYKIKAVFRSKEHGDYHLINYRKYQEFVSFHNSLHQIASDLLGKCDSFESQPITAFKDDGSKEHQKSKCRELNDYLNNVPVHHEPVKIQLYKFLGKYDNNFRELSLLLFDRLLFGYTLKQDCLIITKFYENIKLENGMKLDEVISVREKVARVNGLPIEGFSLEQINKYLKCPNRPIIISFFGTNLYTTFPDEMDSQDETIIIDDKRIRDTIVNEPEYDVLAGTVLMVNDEHLFTADGREIMIDDEGNKYYIDEDNNHIYIGENGDRYYYDSNNRQILIGDDGGRYYIDENGDAIYITDVNQLKESEPHFVAHDEHEILTDEEGNKYYYDNDGYQIFIDPDGYEYYYDSYNRQIYRDQGFEYYYGDDGSQVYVDANGDYRYDDISRRIYTYDDGREYFIDSDYNYIYINPEGDNYYEDEQGYTIYIGQDNRLYYYENDEQIDMGEYTALPQNLDAYINTNGYDNYENGDQSQFGDDDYDGTGEQYVEGYGTTDQYGDGHGTTDQNVDGYTDQYGEGYTDQYGEGYTDQYGEGYTDQYGEGYTDQYGEGYTDQYGEGYTDQYGDGYGATDQAVPGEYADDQYGYDQYDQEGNYIGQEGTTY